MLELGSGLRARLVQTRSFSHSIFHKKPSKTHKSRYLPFAASRIYATSNTLGGSKTPSRKQVTIRNDDGQAKWRNLTNGEKVARAIQQTFNFGIILAGFAGLV